MHNIAENHNIVNMFGHVRLIKNGSISFPLQRKIALLILTVATSGTISRASLRDIIFGVSREQSLRNTSLRSLIKITTTQYPGLITLNGRDVSLSPHWKTDLTCLMESQPQLFTTSHYIPATPQQYHRYLTKYLSLASGWAPSASEWIIDEPIPRQWLLSTNQFMIYQAAPVIWNIMLASIEHGQYTVADMLVDSLDQLVVGYKDRFSLPIPLVAKLKLAGQHKLLRRLPSSL